MIRPVVRYLCILIRAYFCDCDSPSFFFFFFPRFPAAEIARSYLALFSHERAIKSRAIKIVVVVVVVVDNR